MCLIFMSHKCFIIPNFNAIGCNLKKNFPPQFLMFMVTFCLKVCQRKIALDKVKQSRKTLFKAIEIGEKGQNGV